MTKIERHPAPEKLLLQVTTEAVSALALAGEDKSGEAALPDDQILDTYDGPMIAELVWGLFETAIRLDDAQDRTAVHQIAILLAEALGFDEWIEQCGPGNGKN